MYNVEPHVLLIAGIVLVLFLLLIIMRRKTVSLINESLDMQEQTIRQLKKANQLLATMAGVEIPTLPEEIEEKESDIVKLYVGNLGYSVSKKELEQAFSEFGEVANVHIPIDRYTKKTRGFGFVSFYSTKDAKKAMKLNGSELKGREIQVSLAKER